jgi:hypothetical protein
MSASALRASLEDSFIAGVRDQNMATTRLELCIPNTQVTFTSFLNMSRASRCQSSRYLIAKCIEYWCDAGAYRHPPCNSTKTRARKDGATQNTEPAENGPGRPPLASNNLKGDSALHPQLFNQQIAHVYFPNKPDIIVSISVLSGSFRPSMARKAHERAHIFQ